MTWPYIFIYPGGAGGMFVKTVFYYYLNRMGVFSQSIDLSAVINQDIGHCHNNIFLGPHYHDPGVVSSVKSRHPDSQIVYIRIDQDDVLPITRMIYFKFVKDWFKEHLVEAENKWVELHGATSEQDREQRYLSNLENKLPPSWLTDDVSQVDFVLDFKTIYGKNNQDLHQIIVDRLGTTRVPELDEFIYQYRTVNEKYFV
jgi:hypothetical protein